MGKKMTIARASNFLGAVGGATAPVSSKKPSVTTFAESLQNAGLTDFATTVEAGLNLSDFNQAADIDGSKKELVDLATLYALTTQHPEHDGLKANILERMSLHLLAVANHSDQSALPSLDITPKVPLSAEAGQLFKKVVVRLAEILSNIPNADSTLISALAGKPVLLRLAVDLVVDELTKSEQSPHLDLVRNVQTALGLLPNLVAAKTESSL